MTLTGTVLSELDEISARVLSLFSDWGRETLDLHELFEAGDSNDPDLRRAVFFAVEGMVEKGLLEERGNDFYALTPEGRRVAESLKGLAGERRAETTAD